MPDAPATPGASVAPDASTARAVIDHAGVSVADLDRSERFYRDVLGFTTVEDRFAFPEHELRGVVLINPQGARGRAVRAEGVRANRPPPSDRVHSSAGLVPVRPGRTRPRRISPTACPAHPTWIADVWHAELDDRVAVLTYTRPPENVLGFADLAELDQVLLRWGGDERARVIVLTGGIPGYFAAHADLADVGALVHGTTTGPHGPQAWEGALARISAIPQPVIAAVNGQAWGGGFELALSCLMRVASPAAHFRFPEVAEGAIPGAGGTQRLPRLIGLPRATRVVLSGELVTATEALQLGIVDAILPTEGFLDAALDWAAPLASQPRHSLAAASARCYSARKPHWIRVLPPSGISSSPF